MLLRYNNPVPTVIKGHRCHNFSFIVIFSYFMFQTIRYTVPHKTIIAIQYQPVAILSQLHVVYILTVFMEFIQRFRQIRRNAIISISIIPIQRNVSSRQCDRDIPTTAPLFDRFAYVFPASLRHCDIGTRHKQNHL